MKKAIVFINKCTIPEAIQTHYYYQDIRLLRRLGFKVVLSSSYKTVFQSCDLLLVWWWSYALLPAIFHRLLNRQVVVTGTMNIHASPQSIWNTRSSNIKGVFFSGRSKIKSLLIYLAARVATTNILVSKAEYNLARKNLGLTNLSLIPHAVEESALDHRTDAIPPAIEGLIAKQYFLNVSWSGSVNIARKNILGIIEAFDNHASKVPSTNLILAGAEGDGYHLLQARISQSLYSSRIHLIGAVSKKEKYILMKHAICYVQPSYYEGFGLAVAEAMAAKTAVICSSVGGMSELTEGCALHVNPSDIERIASAMTLLLENISIREWYGLKGLNRIMSNYTEAHKLELLSAALNATDRAKFTQSNVVE